MAPPANNLLISCILFCCLIAVSEAEAQPSFRPKALILPVTKDPSTLQYLTQINQRTPLVPVKLALDLGGQYLWVDCEQGYVSSSYKPAPCGSAQCSLANSKSCTIACLPSPRPGCNNNTCGLMPENTVVTRTSPSGQFGQDVVSIQSTDGSNPGKIVKVPNFLFTCGATFLLDGLAKGVKGMAGLGRNKISMPSRFSAAFSFHRKFAFSNVAKNFALCLSSSPNNNGVLIFGDVSYKFFPNIYSSDSFTFTPLILNPVSTSSIHRDGEPSADYFIGVKSIKIDDKAIPLNKTLLSINKQGYGGTKISTTYFPYTAMHTSIYDSLIKEFTKRMQSQGVKRVESVAPFEACFNSTGIFGTRVGPSVPVISLALKDSKVDWNMFGSNSMVEVKKGVMCLGFVDGGWRFVDGGVNPRTAIVIGGHQVEDNLLQFDLAASRLGFSSSLLSRQTTCSNFNFTSTA
ncbi:unnamed protein product [Linum tenue]|uniref:Peptidase A1 domain-containing protein n=1 Tax=Linum tenue TaxID=586396 RepID=A0AAV0P5L7_9ROSI|nr:unnamed protein product [Linum tenue]